MLKVIRRWFGFAKEPARQVIPLSCEFCDRPTFRIWEAAIMAQACSETPVKLCGRYVGAYDKTCPAIPVVRGGA